MMIFTELESDVMLTYELGWWYVALIGLQIAYNYLLYIIPASSKHIYLILLKCYRIISNQIENYKIDYVVKSSSEFFIGIADLKKQILDINLK